MAKEKENLITCSLERAFLNPFHIFPQWTLLIRLSATQLLQRIIKVGDLKTPIVCPDWSVHPSRLKRHCAACGGLLERRVTRQIFKVMTASCQSSQKDTQSGRFIKAKKIWKSVLGCPLLSLSLSSSPPLIAPRTESFLDGFPKLSGVSSEALIQHCPLCMHGRSWVQSRKRACSGKESCCLGATTEVARFYCQCQSQHWPRVRDNFCFQSEEGERERRDSDGSTKRMVVTFHTENLFPRAILARKRFKATGIWNFGSQKWKVSTCLRLDCSDPLTL